MHTKNNTVFGFWVYLMSDCVLFASLFATYAVLQVETAGGPSAKELFSLPFVLIETLILLTSSFTVGLALLAAHAHKKFQTLVFLKITLLLGFAFLGMELYEFRHLIEEGHGPSGSAFLSSFFTLVGTHGAHVAAGSLWMLVVAAHILWRGLAENMTKLMCVALFWHFLDVIWIFIFTFVYLLGAL